MEGGENVTFEERINQVIKDHAVNKKALAELMEMPYTSFLYKCKDIDRLSVLEFRKLSAVLRLTEEEKEFLCNEVK